MHERALARRYARGLFEAARDQQLLDQVERELRLVGPLLAQREVVRFLNSPCVTFAEKRQVLQGVLEQQCCRVLLELLELLAGRRRMKALPDLVRIFGELLDEHRGIVRIKAKLAAKVPEATLAALKAKLLTAIGKRVELEPETDESLIGGAVLVLKDTVTDFSVKGALERLRERMRQ